VCIAKKKKNRARNGIKKARKLALADWNFPLARVDPLRQRQQNVKNSGAAGCDFPIDVFFFFMAFFSYNRGQVGKRKFFIDGLGWVSRKVTKKLGD
jgi:hypothetical protein